MQKSWRWILVGLGLLMVTAGVIVGVSRPRDRAATEMPRAAAPVPPSPDLTKPEPPSSSRPTETPQALPPAPSSPDLPRSEPPAAPTPEMTPQPIESGIVRLLGVPLKGWVASWKPAAPDFDLMQLRKVLEEPLAEDWQPLDMKSLDQRRQPLYVFSPDRTRFMDPYGGMELVEKDGRLIAAFDIDQSITLYDTATSQEMRLVFCGTACSLEDGIWLSNDVIAVVGTSMDWSCQSTPGPCDWGPMVLMFDFSRKIESIYVGPNIDSAQRVPYFSDRLKQRLPEISFR